MERILLKTIQKFIDPSAEIKSVESKPIHIGLQAVSLHRHTIHLKKLENIQLSLITKYASKIERKVLNRLHSQGANVPFFLTDSPTDEERALICLQDVDYQTDYSNLNIAALQQKELPTLWHIHASNLGRVEELRWLSPVDIHHVETMINTRWRPQWQTSLRDDCFVTEFGDYIPWVEAAASTIFKDIIVVINEESTHTLIHNDLNPGNVLVHNNNDVFFIDWEDARYGSLFFDFPLRCNLSEHVERYRKFLADKGVVFSDQRFTHLFTTASRYLGLKYMSWNLGSWSSNRQAKNDLKKYLDMVVGSNYGNQQDNIVFL